MKNKTKVIGLLFCAVLLVIASVFGTLAYLTDTDTVENTFTVGNVNITLDEAPVNSDGKKVTGNRVTANAYHLIPGHEYDKDPTVHVQSGSDKCYVFIAVDNNGITGIEETKTGYTSVADQIEDNGWVWFKNEGNVHYYYYKTVVDARSAQQNLVVFEKFAVGEDVTGAQLETYNTAASENASVAGTTGSKKAVVITAYAIQADGFTSASDAWTNGLNK